jgi:hypothetical protein
MMGTAHGKLPVERTMKTAIANVGGKFKLGLDFGNVIQVFGKPMMLEGLRGAIPALRRIFGDNIFVVSRVNDESGALKSIEFLRDQKLFGPEGLIPSIANVRYCLKRQDKAPIAEQLGLTHFVDDRMEVLHHMQSVRFRYAINPTEDQLKNFPTKDVAVVNCWQELLAMLALSDDAEAK